MVAFILLVLQSFLGDPSIEVARGVQNEIPTKFTPIENITQVEIRSSYWAKVSINPPLHEDQYILQGGNWYMRNLSFYDENLNHLGTGNHLVIRLEKDIPTTIYIFYPFADEKAKIPFNIRLQQALAFRDYETQKNVFQVAFLSILLFPLLVAIFFGIRSKDKAYLYYALYILSIVCFFGYQYGILGSQIEWLNTIPPVWIWLTGSAITLFYVMFSTAFLNMKVRDPFGYKLSKVGILYIAGLTLISSGLYYVKIDAQHALWYKFPTITIQFVLISWFLYRIYLLKGVLRNYFLVGALLLVIISIAGQVMSTLQSVENFNYIIQSGLVTEVLILSVALGVRVDLIQKEKNLAQKELITQLQLNDELQKEYTEELEEKVIKRTASLNKRNEENEMLLREIHHRVKNNLQMITSMINMYNRRSDSEEVGDILTSTRNKIKSMALIHEHLYSHSDFSTVTLNEYLSRLIEMIINSLHKGHEIQLKVEIEPIVSDIQTSISIGLVLNELVTNSLKYAFDEHTNPMLFISLKKCDNSLILIVEDNGNATTTNSEDGLGYTIIKSIIDNMDGVLTQRHSEQGFRAEIQLNDYQLITA